MFRKHEVKSTLAHGIIANQNYDDVCNFKVKLCRVFTYL